MLIAKLREKMNKANAAMRAMLDANPNGLNDEQSKEYDDLEKEFDDTRAQLDKAIQRDAKSKERESFMGQNQRDPLTSSVKHDDNGVEEITSKRLESFFAYVRSGITGDNNRALSTSPDTKGGYLIPATYANSILSALKDNSVLRKYATVIKTNGTFNIPIGGAKPVFGWIDELGTYPLADTDFDNQVLEAWKAGGIIQVAEELLADETFNLETHLMDLIAQALDTLEGDAFLTGDGVKKPLGMSVSIPAANTQTLATLDVISATDVDNLYLSVKASYRKKATWIISDKFFKAIFKMKDANGNPIWTKGLTDSEPGLIHGRPYEIDDNLTGATGTPLAFFGDMKYYQIGDRGEMMLQRLNERYADDGMVGFKVYKRTDGKLTINESIGMLKNA